MSLMDFFKMEATHVQLAKMPITLNSFKRLDLVKIPQSYNCIYINSASDWSISTDLLFTAESKFIHLHFFSTTMLTI